MNPWYKRGFTTSCVLFEYTGVKPPTKLIICIQTQVFNGNFHQHYPCISQFCNVQHFIFVLTVTRTTKEIRAVHGKELKIHMQ